MDPGTICTVPTANATYKNSCLHPSIIEISGGFNGHNFWMAQTPYPDNDDTYENPFIYYGNAEIDGSPPLTWVEAATNPIVGIPASGYRSDTNIFYDGTKLWCIWRDVGTPDVPGGSDAAIFAASSTDGSTWNIAGKETLMLNSSGAVDRTLSPKVIKVGSKIYLLSFQIDTTSGITFYGVTRYEGTQLESNDLSYENIDFVTKKVNIKPWHFDVFDYDGIYYMIYQTGTNPYLNLSGNGIYLGVSTDLVNWRLYPQPLLHSYILQLSLYKPTALVVSDVLYVYYTDSNLAGYSGNGAHRMFRSSISMSDLLAEIDKYKFEIV